MKEKKGIRKILCAAAAIVLALAVILPVSAAAMGKNITVYPGVQLFIDNVSFIPKDANGNSVEVFTYEGTTYLPVRAISDAFKKDIRWDQDTRSVYVNEKPATEINWMQELPPYLTSNNVRVYNGDNRSNYIPVANRKNASGVQLTATATADAAALWLVENRFKTVTFSVCSMGNGNGTLQISTNSGLTGTTDLLWDQPPKTFSFSIEDAQNIKIDLITATGVNNSSFGIYDIIFQ